MIITRTASLLLTASLAGLGSSACFNPPDDAIPTAGVDSVASVTGTTTTPGTTQGPDETTVGASGSSTTAPDPSSSDSAPDSSGAPAECGDGIVSGDEACDDAGESATCNADCTPAACGDGIANAIAGEQCDDAGESATCDVDCTPAECGDGIENPTAGEQCDDGNGLPGDGCEGCLTVVSCSAGAVLLGVNPMGTMAVCDDPTDTVCEQDAETLCPAGWGLCTREQHVNRNDGFDFPLGNVVVGEIHCRVSGGAGHYTLAGGNLNQDLGLNCDYGSSRPSCVTMYGCNETNVHALCCAPTPTCGNGVVEGPEEQCDDANASELDECLNSCGWRLPGNHGQPC